jgi:hypothetical protein
MPRSERRAPYLADPQPTPHDCRHTYATRLADEGVPKHEIGALLGHGEGRGLPTGTSIRGTAGSTGRRRRLRGRGGGLTHQ